MSDVNIDPYPYLDPLDSEDLLDLDLWYAPREVNHDLLDKTLAHVEQLAAYDAEGVELAESWQQTVYRHVRYGLVDEAHMRCRTGMCFAGWACQLAGGHWVGDSHDLVAENDWPAERAVQRATRVLGLTSSTQVGVLFAASNDLEALRALVAAVHAGAGDRELMRLHDRHLERIAASRKEG